MFTGAGWGIYMSDGGDPVPGIAQCCCANTHILAKWGQLKGAITHSYHLGIHSPALNFSKLAGNLIL